MKAKFCKTKSIENFCKTIYKGTEMVNLLFKLYVIVAKIVF